jgi:WD40 repeat protein/serine/threonine protein kinase
MNHLSKREAAIFSAARRLPAGQRDAYLDQACAGDALLRRRVAELLAADEAAGDFLKELALEEGEEDTPPNRRSSAPNPEEKPGDRIGRYKLLEVIGEGGCGVVYVAEQTEPVRRRVALKVIKLGMDTKQVVARFEAERQALALMDHPNIAKVFDAGATDTGRPYFVMELVHGLRITDYCDQHQLTTKERLDLFIKVCQAIQHAHQKGIIHRDIKPSNILVTIHDDKPVPKIIDFGIAKATEGRLTEATIYTQLHQFIGTPAYMSPEQAGLTVLDIDTRSDIYSLGVVLYELLAGRTPFDAKELLASGLEAMRQTIREKDPVKPSTRLATLQREELTTTARRRSSDAPSLLRQLQGDLDWIVMKALEKDRARRYETANGVAADIQRHLDNEAVLARPPSNVYRFQKMVQRNKLAAAAAAAVVAALLIGLGFSWWMFLKEKAARQRAVAAEETQRQWLVQAEAAEKKARTQASRAEAASIETRMTMATSDFMHAVRLISEDDGDEALAYLQRSLSANPTNQAALTRLATFLTYHPWEVYSLVLDPHSSVNSAQFSPDGKRIVTASDDGTARVWDAQTGQPLTESLKHRDRVWSAKFSPDGTRIVTASQDHTARVWDAQTGQPLTDPLRHNSRLISAQFSPDGKRIVTASNDSRVWDAQTGKLLAGPLPHDREVTTAQFSSDGMRVVTGSGDVTARVWDAQSGQPLTEPLVHTGWVHLAQFSPDGKRILTAASHDATARVWDAQTGRLLTALLGHKGEVTDGRFSPDGKRIVTASEDGTARVWDAQSGQPLTDPLKHNAGVNSAQFSSDGWRIVTASGDGTARVWNAQSGQALTEPLRHNKALGSAQFSPDGQRILTITQGIAWVWDIRNGQPLPEILHNVGPVNSVQFSPDGRRIVAGCGDKTARVWDAASGQPLTEPLNYDGGVISTQFSPDGKWMVTTSWDHTARVWDAQSGQPLTEPLQHGGVVYSAQFSPDGKRIVTACEDKCVRVWDAQTGQQLTEPLKHGGLVYSAQFSPEGKRIVTASEDKSARVWDAQTGQPLSEPLKHGSYVFSAQFSPDGKRIVTASYDNTARVWDAQTGQPLTGSLQVGAWVFSAQFSPDGKRIVTASWDRSARVWDAQSGQPLTDPMEHGGAVRSARFSPDGKWIVTASDDQTARIWDAQTGQPLSDPLKHNHPVLTAQFSPDGERILTASNDNTAWVWDLVPSGPGCPAWLLQLSEAVAGLVLNKQGVLEPSSLPRDEIIRQIREKLEHEAADDGWVVWGRWLLANPATRTISPLSKMTAPAWIESQLGDFRLDSLDRLEAYAAAHGNAELRQRIVQARMHPVLKVQEAFDCWRQARPAQAEALVRAVTNEGNAAQVKSWCQQAFESRDRDELDPVAYQLATESPAASRNGAWAVFIAESAVTKTHRQMAGYLDTLAAAYAETGQFDKAVSTEKEAIAALKNETELKLYNSRLELYEAKSPYRKGPGESPQARP